MSETLKRILANPTLYPKALTEEEKSSPKAIKWHKHAHSPCSSQVMCISAFGTLRRFADRDKILGHLVSAALPDYRPAPDHLEWKVFLEYEKPHLLNELGRGQPTSIDTLLVSPEAVVAVEAKFHVDADKGFNRCGQFEKGHCAGFYGPGSDQKGPSQAWCQLEVWRDHRSPRTYWAIGREYFRPEVFRMQERSEACPLRNSNYQLMRNYLFAATYARTKNIKRHGVMTIAPASKSSLLTDQVAEFRSKILAPEYSDTIGHVTYETYIDLLRTIGDECCAKLASFLEERIATVLAT